MTATQVGGIRVLLQGGLLGADYGRMGVRAGRLGRFPLSGVVAWLPRGGSLDAAAWAARHRGICVLLWGHVLVLPWIALFRGETYLHGLEEAAVVASSALGAAFRRLGPRLRSASATLGLLGSSAVVVHLADGVTEAHFHFFVMVAVVALYQAWLPFLLALGFVVVHHGVAGVLVPSVVYSHEAAIANPWWWGIVHGGFIMAQSIACLISWHANERAMNREREVRVLAEKAHQDLADAQELSGIGSWEWDIVSNAVTWSDQHYVLAGVDKVTFVPSVDSFLELIHPDDRDGMTRAIDASRRAGLILDYECRLLRSDGEVRTIHCLGSHLTDKDGIVVHMRGTIHDVTERRRLQDHITKMAFQDPLTGLANRRAADQRLEAWASLPSDAERLTVVLCDVNGLKSVNDKHGHLVGDRLIRQLGVYVSAAAARLPHGIAARMGGDEFLIASPCEDQLLVSDVVDELARAAAQLPYGGGLSCGSAWAGELIRPEPSPQSLVRSLLRLADSQQYRRKLSTGTSAATQESPALPRDHRTSRRWRDAQLTQSRQLPGDTSGSTAAELSVELDVELHGNNPRLWFTHLRDASVEQRLEHAARTVSARAGAVAWWISTVDQAAGTLQAVSCGITRTDDVTDGLWSPVEVDASIYQISDFPLTAQAAQGQAFSADTRTGDPAEQRLLIQLGYQSMIAAGGTDDTGSGWLIEIYGDSLTNNLHEMTGTLHQATDMALAKTTRLGDQVPRPERGVAAAH